MSGDWMPDPELAKQPITRSEMFTVAASLSSLIVRTATAVAASESGNHERTRELLNQISDMALDINSVLRAMLTKEPSER